MLGKKHTIIAMRLLSFSKNGEEHLGSSLTGFYSLPNKINTLYNAFKHLLKPQVLQQSFTPTPRVNLSRANIKGLSRHYFTVEADGLTSW